MARALAVSVRVMELTENRRKIVLLTLLTFLTLC